MIVLAILSLMLAVAASYPAVKTMTLIELSTVIETKADPVLQPYYEDALNQIMYNLYNGKEEFSRLIIPSPSGAATWTIEELTKELEDITVLHDEIRDEYIGAILRAHGIYKHKEAIGATEVPMECKSKDDRENVIQVVIPAMDVSIWTMADLKKALKNKTTKDELKPYLQKAIEDMNKSGGDVTQKTIGIVTPVGLIPQPGYSYSKKKSKRDF